MAREWPTDEAREHLEELARQRDITIRWTEKPPSASSQHRVVWCNPPTTGARYLFGLHELGHVASSLAVDWETRLRPPASKYHGRHGFDYSELICESFAWAWASEMANTHLVRLIPTTELRKVVTSGWGTYLIHCLKLPSG